MTDTGIGLSEEQQNRLFHTFSQADSSTTRKFGGTGLGLVISKKLVEMMGGEIGIISEPGHGSTFWFTALFGRSSAPFAHVQGDMNRLTALRVLLVDDNPSSRTILGKHLDGFGCHTQEAATGEEALDEIRLAKIPFDLVILDWQMPGMDGIETARRLRQVPTEAGRAAPQVILVSAYDRDDIASQAEDLGLAGLLIKPVKANILAETMLTAINPRRQGQTAFHLQEREDDWTGFQILLVEDNDLNQMVAREILEQSGFTVTIAENGREGVEAVRSKHFDCVLMDVQMPVMDGYTATHEIRADPRFNKLPIIAMTANAIVGDRERALAEGMDDYVTKPLDVNQFFSVLRKWVPPKQDAAQTPEPEAEAVSDHGNGHRIDMDGALRRLNGNRDLLNKLQSRFRDNLDDFTPAFNEALANSDSEKALRIAHTLKSAAGTIGAIRIQEAASTMETYFRDGGPLVLVDPILEHMQEAIELDRIALDEILFGGAEKVSNSAA